MYLCVSGIVMYLCVSGIVMYLCVRVSILPLSPIFFIGLCSDSVVFVVFHLITTATVSYNNKSHTRTFFVFLQQIKNKTGENDQILS